MICGGVHTSGFRKVLTWLHSFHLEKACVQLAEKGAALAGSCLHRPAKTCPNSPDVLLEGTQVLQ